MPMPVLSIIHGSAFPTPDTLTGDLPPVILNRKAPYIVAQDIIVPYGKSVAIESGSVFLFAPKTSLIINGQLRASGSSDRAVVFTSLRDNNYNRSAKDGAQPQDWQGIMLSKDASGSTLRFCAILYAAEGLVSATRYIELASCLFLHTRPDALSIEGVRQTTGNMPCEYSLTISDQALSTVPLTKLDDPLKTKRALVRSGGITLLISGALGGGLAAFTIYQGMHDKSALALTQEQKTGYYLGAGVGALGFAWGTVFTIWSFTF